MAPFIGDPSDYDVSSFEDGMKGACLCGNITVDIKQKGLFDKPNGHVCHCYNCRRFAGGSHVNILCLPTANITVSDPKSFLKIYEDRDTGSENTVPRSFCSNCGSPIGCVPLIKEPRLSMVALGLFPKMPEPEFEVFTKHRQDWARPATEKAEQCDFADVFAKYVASMMDSSAPGTDAGASGRT